MDIDDVTANIRIITKSRNRNLINAAEAGKNKDTSYRFPFTWRRAASKNLRKAYALGVAILLEEYGIEGFNQLRLSHPKLLEGFIGGLESEGLVFDEEVPLTTQQSRALLGQQRLEKALALYGRFSLFPSKRKNGKFYRMGVRLARWYADTKRRELFGNWCGWSLEKATMEEVRTYHWMYTDIAATLEESSKGDFGERVNALYEEMVRTVDEFDNAEQYDHALMACKYLDLLLSHLGERELTGEYKEEGDTTFESASELERTFLSGFGLVEKREALERLVPELEHSKRDKEYAMRRRIQRCTQRGEYEKAGEVKAALEAWQAQESGAHHVNRAK